MLKVAIAGYGNIGRYAVEAINAAPDIQLAGVVRRSAVGDQPKELAGVRVVDGVSKLDVLPDAALLCVPSRSVPELAEEYLRLGIDTVDSYDIHQSIYEYKTHIDAIAKAGGATAIISAGWDPGTDSVLRALLEACAPKGLTYTNFGPGMSMGHTVAVKSVEGVENALSITMPAGGGTHKREVYVRLKPGSDFNRVNEAIKNDSYFVHDETRVYAVNDVSALTDMGHGVNMVRKGVSGSAHNQLFEFNMKINNPALTAQIMLGCARAAVKQPPGAYTLPEIPLMDLLYGDREILIKRLV